MWQPTAIADALTTARAVLEAAWQPEPGYTVPSVNTYPHQWLWDSCFHAVVWAALGESDRAVAELTTLFASQHPSGFVPHLVYHTDPEVHAGLWQQPVTSTITQPPMYGHAVAVLRQLGVTVPAELVVSAEAGLRWLATHRRRPSGRVVVVHPWETGCDDSVAWDLWGAADRERWFRVKGELVGALRRDAGGAAVASERFEVASPGFVALCAFNAGELGLDNDGFSIPEVTVDSARCADDLLVALVEDRPDLLALALSDDFGGPFGPAGVRRRHPSFDPERYWRGPAWPQLTYLLWVAASRWGHDQIAATLAERLLAGAERSGFAEFWHPDTGAGLGAIPQSWATLAIVPSLLSSARPSLSLPR